MIYGIGCDMTEIKRVEKSLEREAFAEKVFSPTERETFLGKASKLAGCFAAKEAFAKALGTGVRGFGWDEVSALRDELGKPYYVFTGKALEIVTTKNLKAHLSITNEGGFAMAYAILETE